MYACVRVHVCTCVYMCTCVRMNVCWSVGADVCVCARVCVCVSVLVCVCTCVGVCACVREHILFYTSRLLYSRLYLIQIARRPIRKCSQKKTANQLTQNFTNDLTLLLFTILPPLWFRSLDDKFRNAKLIKQLKNARAKASKASHAQCVFLMRKVSFFVCERSFATKERCGQLSHTHQKLFLFASALLPQRQADHCGQLSHTHQKLFLFPPTRTN